MRKMLHFTVAWALLFVMLFAMPGAAEGVVSNLEVFLQDNVVDRNVVYLVSFASNTVLYGGLDSVKVVFPDEVQIDDNIRKENVSINNLDVPGIDYSDNVLSVLIPERINIASGEKVELRIASGVIKNPREAGTYQLSAYTSKDTAETFSRAFEITDYEYANGVSKPQVKLFGGADNIHEYQIKFKTSVNGYLQGGTGRITLVFPTVTEIPSYINGKNIEVNQVELTGQTITVNGRNVSFYLPAGLSITAGGSVEIVISAEAEIKNQYTSTYNTLKVYTSTETREITSFPYEYTGSSSTTTGGAEATANNVVVVTSPNGSGEMASYRIKIGSQALFSLGREGDGFVLTMPKKTGIPATIDPRYIKVNGQEASGVLCNEDKGQIIFTLPNEISFNQQLEIYIDKEAGLVNPPTAQYKLTINSLLHSGTALSEFYTIWEESTEDSWEDPTETTTGEQPTPSNGSSGSSNSQEQVVLWIDNDVATVGGTTYTMDAKPQIKNNVTIVPVRFLSNALGAEVEYDSNANCVNINLGGKEMTLWIDSILARVEGEYTTLSLPASLINNRLMVPIRFISENFGAHVQWNAESRSITISPDGAPEGVSGGTVSEPTAPENQYPIGYKAYIKSGNSYSNLRQGPGTGYAIAGRVLPGEEMTIMLVDGDWYKVSLTSGQEAWIAGWMVDITG